MSRLKHRYILFWRCLLPSQPDKEYSITSLGLLQNILENMEDTLSHSRKSNLGNIFGIGAVKRATVQGKERHLLMFNSKEHILSIATQGEIQLGVADVEIRKVLSSQK